MNNLTDQERDRFGLYLIQESEQTDKLIEQMGKLPFVANALVQQMKAEAAACRLIAKKLLSTETDTIGL